MRAVLNVISGFRRAWCELTGGHRVELLRAWTGKETPSHARIACLRCGTETRWISLTEPRPEMVE